MFQRPSPSPPPPPPPVPQPAGTARWSVGDAIDLPLPPPPPPPPAAVSSVFEAAAIAAAVNAPTSEGVPPARALPPVPTSQDVGLGRSSPPARALPPPPPSSKPPGPPPPPPAARRASLSQRVDPVVVSLSATPTRSVPSLPSKPPTPAQAANTRRLAAAENGIQGNPFLVAMASASIASPMSAAIAAVAEEEAEVVVFSPAPAGAVHPTSKPTSNGVTLTVPRTPPPSSEAFSTPRNFARHSPPPPQPQPSPSPSPSPPPPPPSVDAKPPSAANSFSLPLARVPPPPPPSSSPTPTQRALPPAPPVVQQVAAAAAPLPVASSAPLPRPPPSRGLPPSAAQTEDQAPASRLPPALAQASVPSPFVSPSARPPPRVAPAPQAAAKPLPGRLSNRAPMGGPANAPSPVSPALAPESRATDVVPGGLVSSRLASAAKLFNPLQMAPPSHIGGSNIMRPGGFGAGGAGAPLRQRQQQQPSAAQSYRGMVAPLDANSLLVRVFLPAGEGHLTLNAAGLKDLARLKAKVTGKLERAARLGGANPLTEDKIRTGVFRIAGAHQEEPLEDAAPMAATLERLAPYVADGYPRTASLELHCRGLAAPVPSSEAVLVSSAARRALSPEPPLPALPAASMPPAPERPPAALAHATHSRPKARRPGGTKSSTGPKFTAHPTASTT